MYQPDAGWPVAESLALLHRSCTPSLPAIVLDLKVTTAVVAISFSPRSAPPLAAIAGALAGVVVGALIGGQIRRAPSNQEYR